MSRKGIPTDLSSDRQVRPFFDRLAKATSYVDGSGNADFPTLKQGGDDVLTVTADKTIENGFDNTPKDHGTVSSGALTIDPKDGQHHVVTNDGAFTLSPASVTNHSCVVLHVTNGDNAGSVSFSGWTKKYPSELMTTTSGDKFAIIMYFYGSLGADYAVFKRQ